MRYVTFIQTLTLFTAASVGPVPAFGAESGAPAPLVIEKQGSFAVGGTVITAPGKFDPIKQGAFNPTAQDPAGQTLHGDHAYVFYQVPEKARALPLVMWHGHGQSAKTWESTPDGREGFQTIFLRQRYPVYLIDQPRRGRAARSTEPTNLSAAPDEQLWFGIFRLGVWPNLYPGVQFARDEESLNQFFRQAVPNTGPFNTEVNTSAISALFTRIGEGILVTHSHSGGMGWATAMKNQKVRAIVSFEPGSNFPFPEGELPEPVKHVGGLAAGVPVPLTEFKALTRIPILIYYGDNIPEQPSTNPGQDQWRAMLAVARQWRDTVNRHGGDATLVHLPEAGLRGNTHFPMSDLNNVEVANHMTSFLEKKGLTKCKHFPYWKTHVHPGSTFKYTMSSLLDLMRWDATDRIELINQPLLMIAGSKADSLYMSEDAIAKATGTRDNELFKIDGATHIETYWVPEYVEAAMGKLTPFFARTLQVEAK